MDGSTVVIAPPDGDMAAYLDQLERLRALDLRAIAPGHGALITDPDRRLADYLVHRRARERQVDDVLHVSRRPDDGRRHRRRHLCRHPRGSATGRPILGVGASAEVAPRAARPPATLTTSTWERRATTRAIAVPERLGSTRGGPCPSSVTTDTIWTGPPPPVISTSTSTPSPCSAPPGSCARRDRARRALRRGRPQGVSGPQRRQRVGQFVDGGPRDLQIPTTCCGRSTPAAMRWPAELLNCSGWRSRTPATWSLGEQARFVGQARNRFEAILAVAGGNHAR